MSNFKKLVEARMAETGESWATAAQHVRSQAVAEEEPAAFPRIMPGSPDGPAMAEWVLGFGPRMLSPNGDFQANGALSATLEMPLVTLGTPFYGRRLVLPETIADCFTVSVDVDGVPLETPTKKSDPNHPPPPPLPFPVVQVATASLPQWDAALGPPPLIATPPEYCPPFFPAYGVLFAESQHGDGIRFDFEAKSSLRLRVETRDADCPRCGTAMHARGKARSFSAAFIGLIDATTAARLRVRREASVPAYVAGMNKAFR